MSLLSLGNVCFRQDDIATAESLFRQAAKMSTEIDYAVGIGTAATNLGEVLMAQDRFDEARISLQQAELGFRSIGALDSLPETLRLGALCMASLGDREAALSNATEAVRLAETTGNESLLGPARETLRTLEAHEAAAT